MIIKDDPGVLVSEFEHDHASQTLSRSIDSDISTSDEDERLRPPSVRKRLRSKRWTPKQGSKRLKATQSGFSSSGSDDATARRKANSQPKCEQTAIQSAASSKSEASCLPRLGQKVKLRRNCRLLNVETIPKHLKAVVQRNQISSPLLRLPWDVKYKIYKLTLSIMDVEITYVPHEHRWRRKNGVRFHEHIPGGLCWITNGRNDVEHKGDPFQRRGAPLIARTCRQIFQDTVLWYYSTTKFSFDNEWVMRKWMKSLAPYQKRAITRLVLPGIADLPKYISKDMSGLRKVYVKYSRFSSKEETEYVKMITTLWENRGISVILFS